MLADQQGKKRKDPISDYVLFDLETTGISTYYDEVVEISAVKVKSGAVVEEFSTLVNPGIPIPFAASNVNGITDDMVKDSPDFQTALADFLEFAGDQILVGHNIASFDLKFLYRDAQKFWGKTIGNDYIDTLTIARALLPDLQSRTLTALANYYNIAVIGAHRALSDCRMNQQVYEQLKEEMKRHAVDHADLPICPKCGEILKKRNGKFGEFWGCSGFPECRYTRNI